MHFKLKDFAASNLLLFFPAATCRTGGHHRFAGFPERVHCHHVAREIFCEQKGCVRRPSARDCGNIVYPPPTHLPDWSCLWTNREGRL